MPKKKKPGANGAANDDRPLGDPYLKDVEVPITEAERTRKSYRVIAALSEVKEHMADIKEKTKGPRDEIKKLNAEVESLRAQCEKGTEVRPVQVRERRDYRRGVKDVIVVVSGKVVETIPLTPDERQETFPEVPRRGRPQKAPALEAVPPAVE